MMKPFRSIRPSLSSISLQRTGVRICGSCQITSFKEPHSVVNNVLVDNSRISRRCLHHDRVVVPRQKYKIPHGSMEQKIQFVQNVVTVGDMDQHVEQFCVKTIKTLSKKGGGNVQSVLLAEQLLDRLVREAQVKKTRTITILPIYYNRVIFAWAKTKVDDSIFKAQALLYKMMERHQDNPNVHPEPDHYTYGAFLYACSLSRNSQATKLADNLMKTLEQEGLQQDPPVYLDTNLYNTLILVHANQANQQYGAATAAEDWLMHLSELGTTTTTTQNDDTTNNTRPPQPDTQSFNRVLKAWSICPEHKGADRAKEILQLMLRLQAKGHNQIQTDHISFGTVIHAYAQRRQPEQAEEIFRQALEHFHHHPDKNDSDDNVDAVDSDDTVDNDDDKTVDLTSCLNAALHAWAKSGRPEAPDRADALLRDGYTLSDLPERRIRLQPDVASHTCCIEAHVKSSLDGGMEQADHHLRQMIHNFKEFQGPAPTTATFHTVIHGWMRSGRPESAKRATELLELMLDLSERMGVRFCAPDGGTFSMCIDMWCKRKSDMYATQKALDLLNMTEKRNLIRSFNYQIVINALCQVRTDEAAFEAEQVLRRFEKQVETRALTWGDSSSAGLYTLIVSALGRVRTQEAADLALQVLRSMPRDGPRAVTPTTSAYTAVIQAFSKLRIQRSGEVAFELFEEMKSLDADPKEKICFDTVAFTSILEALANAGDKSSAYRACAVLTYMLDLFHSGREDLQPDSRCLDACLKALVQSRDPLLVERAAQLLNTMVNKYNAGALSQLPSDSCFRAVEKALIIEGTDTAKKTAQQIRKTMDGLAPAADKRVSRSF